MNKSNKNSYATKSIDKLSKAFNKLSNAAATLTFTLTNVDVVNVFSVCYTVYHNNKKTLSELFIIRIIKFVKGIKQG